MRPGRNLQVLQGLFGVADVSGGGSDSEGAERHFVLEVDQVFQIDPSNLEGMRE
jgi:hypothetical protein